MRWLSLLLVLRVGTARAELPEDAPTQPAALDVKRATVQVTGGGQVEVVGGCWLSDGVCVGSGKALARQEARAAECLQQQAEGGAGFPVVKVAGVVVGALLVGWLLGKAGVP